MSGEMDFIDNVIDRAHRHHSRPRRVRQQERAAFTPGMFARLQVPGSAPYDGAAHSRRRPSAANRRASSFMWSRPDDTVRAEIRRRSGQLVDGDRVIKSGLEPDDRVVVDGLMRVRPGIKVDAAEPAP